MGRGVAVRLLDAFARSMDEIRRMPPREFLALQLVRIAHTLHDAEYLEHVTVPAHAGLVEIVVQGTAYGSGVISVAGDLVDITHQDLDSEASAEALLHRAHCCTADARPEERHG